MRRFYCLTIEKLPLQPSLRVNEPDPLLPDRWPWKFPVLPLEANEPWIEPPPLTEPENVLETIRPPEIPIEA